MLQTVTVKLPAQLKQDVEKLAILQGISLDEFVLWAVAEKLGTLRQQIDDPDFPCITCRRGAAGQPTPVLRGLGIRIQTIVVAAYRWKLSPAQIAEEYGLTQEQVDSALAFYAVHQAEIDAAITAEQSFESING